MAKRINAVKRSISRLIDGYSEGLMGPKGALYKIVEGVASPGMWF